MGRKKRKNDKSEWNGEADAQPFNNPFAALGGTPSAGQPPAEKAPAPEPVPKTPPSVSADDAVPKRAVIRIERKGRGGKIATLVSHLALDPEALERMSKTLRKTLGCGGAVEGDVIVIQGDQRARVEQALRKMGVTRISVS